MEEQGSTNMEKILKKVLNIIRKTSGTYIISKESGEDGLVILPLSEYEALIEQGSDVKGLSEEEFLQKINRDIAVWRSGQEDEKYDEFDVNLDKNQETSSEAEDERGEVSEDRDDRYYFEPID